MLQRICLCFVASFLAGCVTAPETVARKNAVSDLNCPAGQISVKRTERRTYQADGCGKNMEYVCGGVEFHTFCDRAEDLCGGPACEAPRECPWCSRSKP